MSDEGFWLWDLTGASSCSFQSFIIRACQARSWASVCSYMYIKRERKGGVLIIHFSSLLFFLFLFVSLTVVLCTAFALRDARHLKEKISEKYFGENNHKPPDCATKETSDTDVYQCPPQKQNNKKPSCYLLPLVFLISFSPPLSCVCVLVGFFTVCVYLGDRLICTTAVEGNGWHVNIVIWHCTQWHW